MYVLLALTQWFGAAVCDQLAADTYRFDGVLLPLCARCTGMYVTAWLTLGWLAWRYPRSAARPRGWVIVAFVLFFLAWAGDGFNSLFSSLPGLPHLYEPTNLLRLITGTGMGIAMGSFIFIMFNMVWGSGTAETRPLVSFRDFLALLAICALVVLVVQSQWAPLLVPLSVASLLAILTLHGMLMTAMVGTAPVISTRLRGSRLRSLAVGVGVALVYLDAFALVHVLLVQYVGRPL
jgi:uncharacterized membrane protein